MSLEGRKVEILRIRQEEGGYGGPDPGLEGAGDRGVYTVDAGCHWDGGERGAVQRSFIHTLECAVRSPDFRTALGETLADRR